MAVLPDRHAQDQWKRYGACVGHPHVEWWWPERASGRYEQARPICQGCPVRVPCLIEQILCETPGAHRSERVGMWGGTSPIERHRLVRRLRKEPRSVWAIVAGDLLRDLDRGDL